MQRSDLELLEALVMEEVVKRRKLGGYSTDAVAILMLCETVLRLIQHTIDKMPRDRKPKTNV